MNLDFPPGTLLQPSHRDNEDPPVFIVWDLDRTTTRIDILDDDDLAIVISTETPRSFHGLYVVVITQNTIGVIRSEHYEEA